MTSFFTIAISDVSIPSQTFLLRFLSPLSWQTSTVTPQTIEFRKLYDFHCISSHCESILSYLFCKLLLLYYNSDKCPSTTLTTLPWLVEFRISSFCTFAMLPVFHTSRLFCVFRMQTAGWTSPCDAIASLLPLLECWCYFQGGDIT